MGKYYLNGVDLESIGVIVESGSDDFMKLPEAKEPEQYDWAELNGVEVDLSQPLLFKPKNITFRFGIVASSEAQWWSNYNSFINIIKSAGTKRLYVEEFKRSFFVYYKSMNTFQRLSPIVGQTKIGAKYEVTFIEPIPSLLKPYAFLTMQGGGYLLTNSGQIINLNL